MYCITPARGGVGQAVASGMETVQQKSEREALLSGALMVGKSFSAEQITVLTTPTLIKRARVAGGVPIIILNPASNSVGITVDITMHASAVRVAAGSTSAIVVAGVEDVHLHFDITAITGTWSFWAESLDSLSGKYDPAVQRILQRTQAQGIVTKYAYLGSLGIARTFRVRYVPDVAGSITFSLNASLKKNVGGVDILAGVSKTIYIGNANVTAGRGFPILEGGQLSLILDQNTELYGIAETQTDIRVFKTW